jgi:hypothetical protein
MISKVEEINTFFKLPIHYNKEKVLLKENIIKDLELIQTNDPSGQHIYSYFLNNNNPLSNKLVEQVALCYTTDISFIKDNQKLIKEYNENGLNDNGLNDNGLNENTLSVNKYDKIINTWNEIKNDNGFKGRYYYIDWKPFIFLNENEYFLQFMSIYNLLSPVLSLCIPIFLLILPYFILKLKGTDITMAEYIMILKILIQNNAIGKLFTQFNSVSLQDNLYLIISALFYVFSIYQNFLVCYRFKQNMVKIHEYLKEFKFYLEHTINVMENYLSITKDLYTHQEFNTVLLNELTTLKKLYNIIHKIYEFKYNIKKFGEIGTILKTFYQIYDDPTYNQSIMYSLGFHGYIDCIKGLQTNIKERKVNFSQFISKKNKNYKNYKNKFKNNYYACLKNTKHVKNTIKFDKNIIISGPNASGKTTIIKSVLINIILTQQFGCGFYDSAKLKPYNHLHCYLNIPDTSGRDSLFQAEARRCKEIIDLINDNPNDYHFCAFDELYSGTNPEEATSSSIAFMNYIVKNTKLNAVLTTHFIEVCNKLNDNKYMKNCYMDTIKNKKNMIEYLYVLKNGISTVKGGINVLCDMNYPKEIIDNTLKD